MIVGESCFGSPTSNNFSLWNRHNGSKERGSINWEHSSNITIGIFMLSNISNEDAIHVVAIRKDLKILFLFSFFLNFLIVSFTYFTSVGESSSLFNKLLSSSISF